MLLSEGARECVGWIENRNYYLGSDNNNNHGNNTQFSSIVHLYKRCGKQIRKLRTSDTYLLQYNKADASSLTSSVINTTQIVL